MTGRTLINLMFASSWVMFLVIDHDKPNLVMDAAGLGLAGFMLGLGLTLDRQDRE